MEIHVYLHDIDAVSVTQRLDQILTHVRVLVTQVTQMDAVTQAKMDALLAQVTRMSGIEQGFETLLSGLSAQIAELKKGQTDPAILAMLDNITGMVSTVADKGAAAITANSPA